MNNQVISKIRYSHKDITNADDYIKEYKFLPNQGNILGWYLIFDINFNQRSTESKPKIYLEKTKPKNGIDIRKECSLKTLPQVREDPPPKKIFKQFIVPFITCTKREINLHTIMVICDYKEIDGISEDVEIEEINYPLMYCSINSLFNINDINNDIELYFLKADLNPDKEIRCITNKFMLEPSQNKRTFIIDKFEIVNQNNKTILSTTLVPYLDYSFISSEIISNIQTSTLHNIKYADFNTKVIHECEYYPYEDY
jgi:hypothetical protein